MALELHVLALLERYRRVSKDVYNWGPLENWTLGFWSWRMGVIKRIVEHIIKTYRITLCSCQCYGCRYHNDGLLGKK